MFCGQFHLFPLQHNNLLPCKMTNLDSSSSSMWGFVQLSEKLDPETMNLIGEEFMMEGLLLSNSTTSTTSIITGEEVQSIHETSITS